MLSEQRYKEVNDYVKSILGNVDLISDEDKQKKYKSEAQISKNLGRDIWELERELSENLPRNFYYYPYIPFGTSSFIEVFERIKNTFNYDNFIDVGCGIGDKCLLAKRFFDYSVTGVEYNKKLAIKAQKTLSLFGINIINTDAFDFNFSEFNVIYLYVPIKNKDVMVDLAVKILSEMKEGIYIDVAMGFYLLELERKIKIDGKIPGWGRSVILKKDNKLEWTRLEEK